MSKFVCRNLDCRATSGFLQIQMVAKAYGISSFYGSGQELKANYDNSEADTNAFDPEDRGWECTTCGAFENDLSDLIEKVA
jgi:hypothetical protein